MVIPRVAEADFTPLSLMKKLAIAEVLFKSSASRDGHRAARRVGNRPGDARKCHAKRHTNRDPSSAHGRGRHQLAWLLIPHRSMSFLMESLPRDVGALFLCHYANDGAKNDSSTLFEHYRY